MDEKKPSINDPEKIDLKSEDIENLPKKDKEMLKIDVYQSRLIPKLLYDGPSKLGLHWIYGPLIFCSLLISGCVLISYLEGTFFINYWFETTYEFSDYVLTTGEWKTGGFFQDTYFIIGFYVMLLMLISFKTFYDNLSLVFIKLCKNDIIDESKYSFKDFLNLTNEAESFIIGKDWGKKYNYLFHNKSGIGNIGYRIIQILCISMTLILIFNPLIMPSYESLQMWNRADHMFGFIYSSVILFIIWGYLVPIALWNFIATVISVRKIVTKLEKANALKLRPIAPDGAAGLRPLGELTLSMIYTVGIPMIIVVQILFVATLNNITIPLVIIYFILIFIIFFLPLGTAHNVMKKAKEDELEYLSVEFNRVYEHFKNEDKIVNESQREIERHNTVQYMEDLSSLYRQVEKMAVWPFDVNIMTKFIITIIIPFAAVAVQILLVWLGLL